MKSAEKSAKSLERRILHRVREAVAAYRLIEPGDRILVALSGGKDSMALLHFLSVMRRSNNGSFDLKAVHVRMANVDYRTDLLQLKEYAEQRGTGFELLDAAFKPDEKQGRSACFLCSWTRRKALFNYAQANGYNKIALGHHRDDLLQTAMMNLTFNGTFATMTASLAMDKFPITLIRPLCGRRGRSAPLGRFHRSSGHRESLPLRQNRQAPRDARHHAANANIQPRISPKPVARAQ